MEVYNFFRIIIKTKKLFYYFDKFKISFYFTLFLLTNINITPIFINVQPIILILNIEKQRKVMSIHKIE